LKDSRPKAGREVSEAPSAIEIDYTEPPTSESTVTVQDGCKNDIVSDVSVSGLTLTAALDVGQPGRWKVRFAVISGLDGHPTRDAYSFVVEGEADCSAKDGDGPRSAPPEEGGGSGTLLLLVAGSALVLAGFAFAIRSRTS
jgi:methionine-rich copper-binding protein CopC